MVEKLESVVPVKSVYVLGSMTTDKKSPADTDFTIFIKTKTREKINGLLT